MFLKDKGKEKVEQVPPPLHISSKSRIVFLPFTAARAPETVQSLLCFFQTTQEENEREDEKTIVSHQMHKIRF